jgi:hypothetical protein
MEKPEASAGQQKINEYIERIKQGESKDAIFQGLPESFKNAIEKDLNNPEKEKAKKDGLKVPPQYDGLPSYVLEEIWTIPAYVDNEKTRSELDRKAAVIEQLRKKEAEKSEIIEQDTQDQESLNELRNELNENKRVTKNEYEDFYVSNGETDTNMYWYQFRNAIAKRLKEEGKFEWGKERLYFDLKMEDLKKFSDLVMEIAAQNKIPIALKYLDEEKTSALNKDGKETRFVANFASEDDAKQFMLAINKDDRYREFSSDRNMDYSGLKLDNIAHYASGFREARMALERIMHGKLCDDGQNYEYYSEAGKKLKISASEYGAFKNKYEENMKAMEQKKKDWDQLLE